jgi:acetyl-CoA synthetase
MMIKEDISQYDLSSIQHMTTAGEALNPEVYKQFKKATGLRVMEGFGQTETTLSIANLMGDKHKLGSMGKPSPLYDVDIVDPDGNSVPDGETGEIVIRTDKNIPCGLFTGYYLNDEKTKEVWHDGAYHTGDTAYRDKEGFYWFVGRTDDLIKSSGYRISPFEVEEVLHKHPAVLEVAVTGVEDKSRGQAVKATVVLQKGYEASKDLAKEIQLFAKNIAASYKSPRIIDFVTELPKTISGKIRRATIRDKDAAANAETESSANAATAAETANSATATKTTATNSAEASDK